MGTRVGRSGPNEWWALSPHRGEGKHPRVRHQPYRRNGRVPQQDKKAFDETRVFLDVRSRTDWSECFYQYANRLAHLYFLRELNKVDAALVFVYFEGDTTASGKDPVSHEGWQAAIGLATHHLGIRAHSPWIRDNVADVFIDVGDLGHIAWP